MSTEAAPAANSAASFSGYRQEPAQEVEGLGVRATVVEHPEQPGLAVQPAPSSLVDEPFDRRDVEVAHDLGEVEIGREPILGQVVDLPHRVRVGIGPASKRQSRFPCRDLPPEFPRVVHASRPPHVSVAAEHHERGKPVLPRLLRVAQAKLEGMLRRQERDDAIAGDVVAEVRDQVAQVVFLLRADGAVCQKDRHILSVQRPDGMVRIDPGVHPLDRSELRTRRAKLCGDHGIAGLKRIQDRHRRYRVVLEPAAGVPPTAPMMKSNMSRRRCVFSRGSVTPCRCRG